MPRSVKKHKAIGVKQAWSIKNYRYVCNVSETESYTIELDDSFDDTAHVLCGESRSLRSRQALKRMKKMRRQWALIVSTLRCGEALEK
jgi:hypothetical protein